MEQNTAPQGEQAALPPENTANPKGDAPQSSSEQDGLKLLAGKFKAVPDLEKSYQEAQRELTKTKQELAELRKGKAEPKADAPVADEKPAVKETVEQKKARVGESLMAEYIEKGSLSEETRIKAVEELGLPAQVVAEFEKYLANQKEAGLKKIKDTFSEFGEFDLNAVIDDMSRTLPPERLNAIQTLVDAGDLEVLRPYIKSHVKAKLPEAQVGRAGGSGAGGFKDKGELRKAMLSPKFGTDKAYTDEFWARNAASAENVRLVR
jgi:hypothetical protein